MESVRAVLRKPDREEKGRGRAVTRQLQKAVSDAPKALCERRKLVHFAINVLWFFDVKA